jgi:RimJ/RimL family protein N-acetyltransferase
MVLRQFTEADAAQLAGLHGDPRVMRHIDDGRPVPREVVVGETLPVILSGYRTPGPGYGFWAAVEKRTQAFLGWFSLRPAASVGLSGGLELGYRLLPAYWGRGYASEGARALVELAFTELRAERVVATTMTVNMASRRVLEKAGLVLVRTFFAEWPEYLEDAEYGDAEYELTRSACQRRGSRP